MIKKSIVFKLINREEFSAFLPQLYSLYRTSFNHPVTEEYLRWRYLDNPVKVFFVQAALFNDTLIGSAAMSPCFISVSGNKMKSALAINLMVHPHFRGKGIIIQLLTMLSERLVDKGYQFYISYPNEQSHRLGVLKLGWKDVYEIPTLALDVVEKPEEKYSCPTDHSFSLDYSGVCPFPLLNRIVKHRTYLRWRYYENPFNKYHNYVTHVNNKVSSFMVVKQFRDRLNIIDFQPRDPEEGAYLLNVALGHARSLNLKKVTLWAPRHTFIHTLCEKKGFKNEAPVTYFCLKELTDLKVSTDFSVWYIQMGDFNAY